MNKFYNLWSGLRPALICVCVCVCAAGGVGGKGGGAELHDCSREGRAGVLRFMNAAVTKTYLHVYNFDSPFI